jgi:hypothetical protein
MNALASIQLLGLPPLEQVGFVFRDAEAAAKMYEPLFGPFTFMDAAVEGAIYRGQPTDLNTRMAFGKSGDVEIELIQVLAGKGPHSEFLEQGREGLHHIRFRADDLDAWTPRLAPLGYQPIWYKCWPDLGNAKACYFERPGDPLLIEFFERNW